MAKRFSKSWAASVVTAALVKACRNHHQEVKIPGLQKLRQHICRFKISCTLFANRKARCHHSDLSKSLTQNSRTSTHSCKQQLRNRRSSCLPPPILKMA